MNTFKDAMRTILGQDLEEVPKKPAKTKGIKSEKKDPEAKKAEKPAEKKPERKDVASREAVFAAYDYVSSDSIIPDLKEALKTGSLSNDLIALLECLFDKEAVREIVSAQGDVRKPEPKPDEYDIVFSYIHPDTKEECMEQAKALLAAGTKLENLGQYNIALRVFRKRKSDGKIIGEADEKEIAAAKAKLEAKAASATTT